MWLREDVSLVPRLVHAYQAKAREQGTRGHNQAQLQWSKQTRPSQKGKSRIIQHRVEESLHSIEENPAKNEVARVLTEGINKDVMIVFDQFEETVQGKVFAE